VTDDAKVTHCFGFGAEQQVTDAGTMHFDAQAVDIGMRAREREQRLAGAETDLDHARRAPAEQRIEIESVRLELDAVDRPKFIERALLRDRGAPRADDEAADRASSRLRGMLAVACFVRWVRRPGRMCFAVHGSDSCSQRCCARRCSNSRLAAEWSGAFAR